MRPQYEVNTTLHIHQARAMLSKKKMIALFGGIGCGKTFFGSLWSYNKTKSMTPGQIGLIAANSYPQLRDSTLRALYLNFKAWNIKVRPATLPKGYMPFTLEIWSNGGWCEVLCRSLDNYEMLSGTELAWAWLDETWQTKSEAIKLILARLRSMPDDEESGRFDESSEEDDSHLQMLMTTTLDDPDSAQHEMFEEKYNEKLMDVIYANTYDNKAYLPKNYIEDLKAFYTLREFQRMVLSKWVYLKATQVYYNFDPDINVDDRAEFDPEIPIMLSFDFNIGAGKPFSVTMSHVITRKRIKSRIPYIQYEYVREFHTFDEIVIESTDTNDMLEEFMSTDYYMMSNKPVFIYGDATGRNKDTRSKTTDYEIIGKHFPIQKVPRKNPPLRSRHNAANVMLQDANKRTRAYIHPRCKTLIKGLANVKLKEGSQYSEVENRQQHVTTAWSYNLHQEFPIEDMAAHARNLSGV